jgi:myo-inositol 2-dehydrogenase/D-chiro-inositol 1-dehydrogenase
MLSTALFGVGFIGRVHARNLARHPEIDLRYVADPDPAGEIVASEVGARYLAGVDDALADDRIDAVWIASPPNTHPDLIVRAAKAGKGIFCEKPIGIDLAEVDRLVGRLASYNRPLMIGFNRRFDRSHSRLKKLVEEGRVGTVEFVSITSRDPNPPPVQYMRATPGGIFYDTMIHDFDMARWLLGEEPIELYATASCHLDTTANPDREPDAATATLKTGSGAVCQISVSRRAVYGYDQRIEVFGSRGMVQSENHNRTNVRIYGSDAIGRDPLMPFFIDRYADAFVSEIDAFIAAVRGDRSDYPNAVDGRQALFLSMAALNSSRAGQPLSLDRPHQQATGGRA